MDSKKVGKLILTLRKEKNMTQKQLADLLNISDKTISKWECGLGCPDISLLNELSNIFNINIDKILLGELDTNKIDGGNMKRIKFYVCPNCGNITTCTGDAQISCCGRKLQPTKAIVEDSNHKITLDEVETDYYITIDHEMTKDHFISFVAYVNFDRVLIVKLYPEQNPSIRIPASRKGKLYIYCNKHGLISKK